MSQIDPMRFGELTATVESHSVMLEEIRADVKTLLEQKHQSRGLWFGIKYAGIAGACLLSGSAGAAINKLLDHLL